LSFLSIEFVDGPALEYEQLRRKIERQTRELSYFMNSQMGKLNEKLSDDQKANWKLVIDRFNDQYRFAIGKLLSI